jgi:hypothetical protein
VLRAGAIVLAFGLLAATTVANAAPPQLDTAAPEPSIAPSVDMVPLQTTVVPSVGKGIDRRPFGAPPLNTSWGGVNFDDNPLVNAGFYYIPPDPHGAAGPFHVVNVVNTMIQWFTKAGVASPYQSLNGFFSPIGPPLGTSTFDPKVLYDQYADRFVVVTLERTTAPTGSYILVAVSKTNDPNLGWWYGAINSKLLIGGVEHWADYPGLAVDDKAIYITNNMFSFPGAYGGSRLWIVDKNPLYAGGALSSTLHDPYTAAGIPGFATTTMPSHMYGAALPPNMGTYLVSYSGLTNGGPGGIEFVAVIEVTSPLGVPAFTSAFVPCTDIENVGGIYGWPALPDAPQLGTGILVEVNDRRALDAVWRNNQLYLTGTINPNAGPDAGQTTAHWWRLNTTAGIAAILCADEGNVGAEDLCVPGGEVYTFFPSVAVDKCDNMSIGFAASGPCIYPGAYYTGRLAGDPPGTTQPTGVLQVGLDFYNRWFGGPRNRWGDYSAIAIDPADDATFWVFNEYASTRGTILTCCPTEDGRWATHWGSFNLGCAPVAVAISSFEARMAAGGVELKAELAASAGALRVNVYRGEKGASPIRYKSVELGNGRHFHFVDALVEPGKTYEYYIGAVDIDGEFFSPTIEITVPGLVTTLHRNKPNPFNPTTSIRFDLSEAAHVTISVFDAAGRLVRTLVDENRGVGVHVAEWDGRDAAGRVAPSGVYFTRMEAGKFVATSKMVMMK